MSGDEAVDTTIRSKQGQRSRTGCWNCRSKTVKKKCDQERPICGRCQRLNLDCDYTPRPTLAERRRIDKLAKLAQENGDDHPDRSSSSGSSSRSTSPSLAIVPSAAPQSSASSLDLSATDHEAIRYFRYVFPKSQHVKHTDYSLIALMFEVAREEPMVMHMVIAISLQEMNSRRRIHDLSGSWGSIQHYSAAIRLIADAVSPNLGTSDLDTMCTTLWMMLLYEQQFGDSHHTAYVHHLKGMASLLQFQFNRVLDLESDEPQFSKESVALMRRSKSRDPTILSAYSARILVWTALMDSAAASAGIGGHVNATILGSLLGKHRKSLLAAPASASGFARLRHYSAPLYHLAWGSDYPVSELSDDLENKDVYLLLTECVQLRYMIANLATTLENNDSTATQKTLDLQTYLFDVRKSFASILLTASELSIDQSNESHFVANIRLIVPMYYAVVLDFMRLIAFGQPLGEEQRHAIKEIMNLAYQTHMHSDDEAMIKVAWPLFIAALETDDMLHQEWIVERFQVLSTYGKNFQRAHQFLLKVIPLQKSIGARIDVRAEMQHSAIFVLG